MRARPKKHLVPVALKKTSRSSLEIRYQRLQKEILEISGREQQRIGQDLHDDLCQKLTGITLLTEVLESKLSRQSLPEAKDAGEIQRLIAKAIVQTRVLAKGLLPIEIAQDGLLAALEGLAANTEKSADIRCRVETPLAPIRIQNGVVAVHLYRIAQEAVANAVRHARADRIVIRLNQRKNETRLSVTDDGRGMVPGAARNGGLGLSIMNSRAETINGTLKVRKASSGGTEVTCVIRQTSVG